MRCQHIALFISLSILLLLQGCASQALKQGETLEFIRGLVSKTEHGFAITPCFSHESRPLLETHEVAARFKEQTRDVELPVYMELKAAQQTDLNWRVLNVSVAGGNVQTCRFDLADIRLRAGGSKPMWIADFLDDSIRVQIVQDLRTLKFPVQLPENLVGSWSSDLKGVRDESYNLSISILDQACRDEFKAWYRWTAEMTLNGTIYSGCAREGNSAQRSIIGSYSNDLKEDQVFVVLDLKEDQAASMLLDYRNGQPLIVMSGEWKWNEEGRLMLHFIKQDGQDQQSIMWFKRSANGSLVQDGFTPQFGRSGFELRRAE